MFSFNNPDISDGEDWTYFFLLFIRAELAILYFHTIKSNYFLTDQIDMVY